MEDFYRKYSFQFQGFAAAVYALLALGFYFSTPNARAVTTTFNVLTLLAMLGAVAASFWTVRYSLQHTDTRENREHLTTGLVLWSLAQIIWFFFPNVLKNQGVLLNLADILWGIGSIFLLRVLVFQDDLRARKQSEASITWISITLAVLSAIPLFLSLPTMFSMNGAHVAGYLTRFMYLGLNLALITFAVFSFSFKNRGAIGVARNVIAAFFMVVSVTSLAQYYFAWFAPITENFAAIPGIIITGVYLFLAINIHYSWMLEQQTGLGTKLKLGFIGKDREIPQFLLHTDAEGSIVFVSNNFLQFTNNSLPERYLGKPLRDVLGFSEQEFDALTETCARGAFIVQQDIRVAAGQKAPVPLFMTAVGSITGNVYFGMDIILHLPNYSGQAYPLDPESTAIAQRILNRTGQHSKENGALLAEYFIAQIQAYKELITNTQGNKAAADMDKQVNTSAEKNKWPIRLAGTELNIEPGFDNFDNAELIKAMPVLFRIARQYTSNLAGDLAVARQTARVDQALSEKIMQAAKQFGLR